MKPRTALHMAAGATLAYAGLAGITLLAVKRHLY